ncbi:MAG: ATP synthase subunit I [Oscillospiraceae bacterium]|nr:ATP synthase subunit I [Oscillospiraceae bacterium]
MDSRKFILQKTAILTVGQVVCIAAMVGIFALLNQFNYTVVLGGVIGGVLAIGNFFFMAIGSDAAADKAAEQDVKTGKALMKSSYGLRMVVTAVLLVVFAKSGHCNVIALACPLLFNLPIIMVTEFFRKGGGVKK